jgi:putative flippase GtrA
MLPAGERPWYRPDRGPAPMRPALVARPRWGRVRRAGRFSVVGAAGLVVNNGVLMVLHGVAGLALLPATVVAVESAIVHNYVWHELWTFRRQTAQGLPAQELPAERLPAQVLPARRAPNRPPGRRLSVRRFATFNATAFGALLINVCVVAVLAWLGLFYLVANLVGIGAAFAVNLAVSSTWIWSERIDGTDPAGRHQPGVAGPDGAGRALPVPHDLHVGPARGGRARPGSRGPRCAGALLYRDRARPARGGRHPGDHRPRRTH